MLGSLTVLVERGIFTNASVWVRADCLWLKMQSLSRHPALVRGLPFHQTALPVFKYFISTSTTNLMKLFHNQIICHTDYHPPSLSIMFRASIISLNKQQAFMANRDLQFWSMASRACGLEQAKFGLLKGPWQYGVKRHENPVLLSTVTAVHSTIFVHHISSLTITSVPFQLWG
jgi:hypothetical protein